MEIPEGFVPNDSKYISDQPHLTVIANVSPIKSQDGYVPPEPYNYPHSMPYVSGGKVTIKLRAPK